MLELNKVMLIGNLTRDPELRSTSTGHSVADMRIAVNTRRRFDRESGTRQEDTVFIDVTAWERTAEFCSQYLSKGRRIFVEGRLKQDNWTDRESGRKMSKINIVAERIQFADPRPGGGEDQGGEPGRTEPAESRPEPERAESAGAGPVGSGGGNANTEDDLPF